jgi:esterase
MMELNFKKLGEGQPLIILHGLFGSLDNWMTLAKKFAEDFEVYLVDARNHGQSPHTDEFGYDVMAQDLKEFISQHNISDPIVLGHSMGGKTAMLFALQNAEMLQKLIVVDIAPKKYPIHHREILDALLSLDFSQIKSRGEADDELAKMIDNFAVRQFLLKNLYWKEKDKLAFRFNLDVLNRDIEKIVQNFDANNSFEKPTMFIRGLKSEYILDSDFNAINNYFPNNKMVSLNCGHWIHAEKPEEFYTNVINFIK